MNIRRHQLSNGTEYAQPPRYNLRRLHIKINIQSSEVSTLPSHLLDPIDARLLLGLAENPRATAIALADKAGLSRNTVQARLAKLEGQGSLGTFERRIDPAALGYSLTAVITAQVTQRMLDQVAESLAGIAEVLEVQGLSDHTDLVIRVVAADADGLYRVAGQILATPGVERTSTALVMRQLVDFRLTPLLQRLATGRTPNRPAQD